MAVRWSVWALSLAIFLYVGYRLATSPMDWPDLQRLGMATVGVVIGVRVFQHLVALVQWKVLQDRLSPVSLRVAAWTILPTLYAAYFPFRGTMVLLRLFAARRAGVPYREGAASLFVHFLGKWVLMAFGLLLAPLVFPVVPWSVYAIPLGGLALVGVLYGMRKAVLPRLRGLVRRALRSGALNKAFDNLSHVETNVWTLLTGRGMAAYAGLWLIETLVMFWAIHLVWQELGYSVSYLPIVFAGSLALIIGWLSQLPAGFGATEGAFAVAMTSLGVPVSVSVAVTLVWRTLFLLADVLLSAATTVVFLALGRAGVREVGNGQMAGVTLIGTLPPIKGISPYCLGLAQALDKRVDVEFLGFRKLYPEFLYPGGTRIDPKQQPMLHFERVTMRNSLTYYNPLSWIRAGITLQGKVVHAQWWTYVLAVPYVVILGLARLRGRRCLITVHNVYPHEGGAIRRLLHLAVLKLGHQFIVHDERNRGQLASLLKVEESRIHVIPHGVLEPAPRRGVSMKEARARLGVPADAEAVLYFGNIRPYKGVDVLLKAMADVVGEESKAFLLVAGKPWGDWEPYQRIIDREGLSDRVGLHLQFIQPADVEDYFAAANLVVLPYTVFDAQSGVGAVVLYFSRALLVTDVGGLPHLVQRPEAVVPPEDPQPLARAILRVLRDAALQKGMEEDSRRVAEGLQWDAIAAKTVEVYDRMRRSGSMEGKTEAV